VDLLRYLSISQSLKFRRRASLSTSRHGTSFREGRGRLPGLRGNRKGWLRIGVMNMEILFRLLDFAVGGIL
jgi:hypothetical protein